MKIFNKRPLSLILSIILGGFVFFYGSSPFIRIVTLCALAASLTVLTVISIKIGKMHWLAIISCISLAITVILSGEYYKSFNKYNELEDGSIFVGTVTDKQSDGFYITMQMSVQSVNGVRGIIMPSVTLSGYAEELAGINEGTKISLRATVAEVAQSSSYNISRGIGATLESVEDINIISHNNKSVTLFFSEIRRNLTRHAIMTSDAETGGLLSALLLGERSSLDGKLSLDFKRIGITHILALSGMHLAILYLGITKILSLLGCGKKAGSVFVIIITLGYMLLTGMSVSVTRAGIMLILSTLLYLFSTGHDSFTSLVTSVFIIALVTPYALFDISLWLSAFATLGVIAFSEYDDGRKKSKQILVNWIRWLYGAVLVSVFAIGCTCVITALFFGSMSALSPISTIVFSPLVQIFVYFGCVTLILGEILPIGKALIFLKEVIATLSSSMSNFNSAIFSTEYPIVKLLLITVFIGFILFLVLNIKTKRLYIGILCGILTVTLTVGILLTQNDRYDDSIVYAENKTGDTVLIKSDGVILLADASRYGSSSAYASAEFLYDNCVTDIDGYYLTHYSKSLPEAVKSVLTDIKVKKIHLPLPQNSDEKELSKSIEEIAINFKTGIEYYLAGGNIEVGKYTLMPRYTTILGGGTNKTAFGILTDKEYVSYLSSGMLEGKAKAVAQQEIGKSNLLIFGNYGKSYTSDYYIEFENKDLKMICVNGDSVYFTPKSLSFYDSIKCKICKDQRTVTLIKR